MSKKKHKWLFSPYILPFLTSQNEAKFGPQELLLPVRPEARELHTGPDNPFPLPPVRSQIYPWRLEIAAWWEDGEETLHSHPGPGEKDGNQAREEEVRRVSHSG